MPGTQDGLNKYFMETDQTTKHCCVLCGILLRSLSSLGINEISLSCNFISKYDL